MPKKPDIVKKYEELNSCFDKPFGEYPNPKEVYDKIVSFMKKLKANQCTMSSTFSVKGDDSNDFVISWTVRPKRTDDE